MAINPLLGQSSEYFGHADYEAALRGGSSNQEILNYLNNNLGQLRGDNVPGGPGLYGEVQASLQAQLDNTISSLGQRLDQQSRSFASSQDQFRSQMAEQQAMFQKQQAEFSNLSRADVPNAEKSAAAEQRRELGQQTRKTSGLSSLAIVSGLGTQANPLSGLQLA